MVVAVAAAFVFLIGMQLGVRRHLFLIGKHQVINLLGQIISLHLIITKSMVKIVRYLKAMLLKGTVYNICVNVSVFPIIDFSVCLLVWKNQ